MKISSKIFSDDRLSLLDYVLAAMAGMTATYSMGMSLSKPQMGWFFVFFIGLGMMVSFGIQRLFNGQKWLEVGGFLYFIFAVTSVFYSSQLNGLLPEGGFDDRQLVVAGILSWMILLGSWVSFRDSTLLFQAVPSIALFGLVGAFDNFIGATFSFFLFLLCLATLFARAHGRSMLKQAFDSGFSRLDTIRQGPWRWMAGPEWALASAAVVILISVFGAPMLRESVKGVSGLIRFPLPNLNRNRQPIQAPLPGLLNTQANSVPVGTGPMTILDRLVFKAKLDAPRYLRTASYSSYQNGTWNKVQIDNIQARQMFNQTIADRAALVESGNYKIVPFEIAFEGMPLGSLPAPGEVITMEDPSLFQVLLDGSVSFTANAPFNAKFGGRTAVLKDGIVPSNVPNPLPEFLWRYAATAEIPAGIGELADQVTQGLESEYEMAQAIKAEIERRCKYNLSAESAPRGRDPVRNFLFGKEKEGYCDLFASAMVLMARWKNIPARYARGYYPLNGDDNRDGWMDVTQNCAHAWAELYFEGFGWVVFDPTEGAEAVPGSGRGATSDLTPWYQKPWFGWMLNGVIAFSVVGAGLFAVRGIRRVRASLDWDQIEMAKNYETFAASLQKASGQPRRPSQTASEYLSVVYDSLGTAKPEASRINGLFEQSLYGPPSDDKLSPADLREPVKGFRKLLKEARRRV